MTTTTDAALRTLADDYATVRTSVGAYRIDAPLVRLRGDDRLSFLDGLLAKSADFVEPDTVREALALRDDGTPFAILLHCEVGEESWLLPRTRITAGELRAHLDGLEVPPGVTVETEPEGWGVTAFEGPAAWAVAAAFVDFDISGLPLHAVTEAAVPGAPAAVAHLARVGTTGEYGYLLISDTPEATHRAVLAAVREQGGHPVGREGLDRVRAEAGMALCATGFLGLTVDRADLSWMVDWDRLGEFRGSGGLARPAADGPRLTALTASPGSRFAAGAEVTAAGQAVGTVLWQAPSANGDEELVLALLDAPFWVPGLDLAAEDEQASRRPLSTVTLPRVVARSLTTRIS
ncbi:MULTISPECIES: aminomethyltransferase family protein [unclassified Streptomyces]|uniref:aminomethyltransferase family protein n=1 Tax=unclassified Streptomyces TaxID=2593676 RepID=UPI000F451191|nr:aminomethyltransferase family protein [Streptomyces sp. I6]RNL73860.1 aminomethyl transferase family protein [Streptomyces sp. I6]